LADVPLADAKARLSELVVRAAAGDIVRITRRGKPVAQITGVGGPRAPVDVAALQALTAAMPQQDEPAAETVRRLRDDARY
jgi:prevent-host-death family protein